MVAWNEGKKKSDNIPMMLACSVNVRKLKDNNGKERELVVAEILLRDESVVPEFVKRLKDMMGGAEYTELL